MKSEISFNQIQDKADFSKQYFSKDFTNWKNFNDYKKQMNRKKRQRDE